MEHLEHSLTMMPSIILTAKLTPPGIESTIMSFSTTIVRINQYSLRGYIGILLNQFLLKVTKADIEEKYYILTIITFIGTLIPMTYIYYFIPSNK